MSDSSTLSLDSVVMFDDTVIQLEVVLRIDGGDFGSLPFFNRRDVIPAVPILIVLTDISSSKLNCSPILNDTSVSISSSPVVLISTSHGMFVITDSSALALRSEGVMMHYVTLSHSAALASSTESGEKCLSS